MTGYALVAAEHPRGALSLELKSVNSRFLDLQFRVADELRALEPLLREAIAARVARGKVDCRLSFAAAAATAQALDPAALEALRRLAGEAQRAFPQAAPLRVGDVLRWPGVLAGSAPDAEEMKPAVGALARRAVEELCGARAREGAKLAALVAGRVAQMRVHLAAIRPLVPEASAAYQARLAERLREALGSADDERIRTEIAVFAVKTDVEEELQRLEAHLGEVERTLHQGGAAGKRLDFLAQELNREANTLAAKAATPKLADCALELKLLVEQIREQVRRLYPESIGIFILPPSMSELERRLRARAQDTEEVIRRRLRNATDEMSHAVEFKYAIINNNFDDARLDLRAIVRAERLATGRQLERHPEVFDPES